MRTEAEILGELRSLCQNPGYVHVLAYLCVLNDYGVLSFSQQGEAKFEWQNPNEPLIRTELCTILGLMVQKEIDWIIPSSQVIKTYAEDTERLARELHESMFPALVNQEVADYTKEMCVLKEPIFYSSESAHWFQYRDCSIQKYRKDNSWLRENKGFTIEEAAAVFHVLHELQDCRMQEIRRKESAHVNEQTILPAFTFTFQEIQSCLMFDKSVVEAVIKAFSLSSLPANQDFNSIGDFNEVNARPIIPLENGEFLVFQHLSYLESLYESPFYWMQNDSQYKDRANEHRGQFTEDFVVEKLKIIFGEKRVFKNVYIKNTSGDVAGEIDAMVVYADRIIIVQAKSKKLTLKSRQGDRNQLRDDFNKSVQESYDQGWSCANFILDKSYIIESANQSLSLPINICEIFIFCVVSDHYPSLSMKVRYFLQTKDHDIIRLPCIMDIFCLDVLTEFLTYPLLFVHYAHKRSKYYKEIMASNEMVVLGYYLKNNLWFEGDEKMDMVSLGDGCAQELDGTFILRRVIGRGEDMPDGLLKRFQNDGVGRLLNYVASSEDVGMLELGLFLLDLTESGLEELWKILGHITQLSQSDNQSHDVSLPIGDSGITIHCNTLGLIDRIKYLKFYVELRKYDCRASKWFGISRDTWSDVPFITMTIIKGEWQQSDEMDRFCSDVLKPTVHKSFIDMKLQKKRLGRNDLCLCGSGKKSKKCCYC